MLCIKRAMHYHKHHLCSRMHTTQIDICQSSQKLNMRFNDHRSDVNMKPKSCEFAQHFHGSHECDIKKYLKVYILQDNVIGPLEKKRIL